MSKEHAYAYEAGYRDGSTHYELEHCPACKNVADLQEALAENVRLREELEAAKHDLQVFSMRSVQLDADNAKLLELLTFYLGCLTKGHVNCDSCAFAEYLCEHGRLVIDWARELGIEVDE